VHTVYVKNAF